jgi:hypothetical protein
MVCESIMHDNGAINRVEPAPTAYHLPYYGNSRDMDLAELQLAALTSEEFADFAIGEESEQERVVGKNVVLLLLHHVLNIWFEEGMQ